MDSDIVFVADDLERLEGVARRLIYSTLAPLEAAVDIVAVRVGYDIAYPLAMFDFHCTILLKIGGGATIRAEACGGDDLLAVYRALSKILDQIVSFTIMGFAYSNSGIWMLGLILLALGLSLKFKKPADTE